MCFLLLMQKNMSALIPRYFFVAVQLPLAKMLVCTFIGFKCSTGSFTVNVYVACDVFISLCTVSILNYFPFIVSILFCNMTKKENYSFAIFYLHCIEIDVCVFVIFSVI